MTKRHWLAVLASATIGLVLAGCGSSTEIVGSGVGNQLQTDIQKLIGPEVSKVSCPSRIDGKTGTAFVCVAHGIDGTTARLAGKMLNDNGRFKVPLQFVRTANVQTVIVRRLQPNAAGLDVRCPDLVRRTYPSTRVTCVISAAGSRRDVFVVVKSAGTATMKLGPVLS